VCQNHKILLICLFVTGENVKCRLIRTTLMTLYLAVCSIAEAGMEHVRRAAAPTSFALSLSFCFSEHASHAWGFIVKFLRLEPWWLWLPDCCIPNTGDFFLTMWMSVHVPARVPTFNNKKAVLSQVFWV